MYQNNKKIAKLGLEIFRSHVDYEYIKTEGQNVYVKNTQGETVVFNISAKRHVMRYGVLCQGKNTKALQKLDKLPYQVNLVFIGILRAKIVTLENFMKSEQFENKWYPIHQKGGGRDIFFKPLGTLQDMFLLTMEENDALTALMYNNKFDKNQLSIL